MIFGELIINYTLHFSSFFYLQHIYHESCIKSWLEIHGTCPICRKAVDNEAATDTSDIPGTSGTSNGEIVANIRQHIQQTREEIVNVNEQVATEIEGYDRITNPNENWREYKPKMMN